jgi:CO/xanthine dehydrogenase Mo-binding subunit
VVGVFAAADIVCRGRIPVRLGPKPAQIPGLQPLLATDFVRYVGEPVAVIVAEDRYVAEDALELIAVDWEPLPAITDAHTAQAPGAPSLHDGAPANLVQRFEVRTGDPEQAMATADVRLRDRFDVQRHTGVPMETRGLLAGFDVGTGMLTLYGPTKAPYFTRRTVADLIDHPEHLVQVVRVDVGGGFGVRGEFYPEDALIPWLARHLRRPVQWIEDRREHLMATNHSRQQTHEVEIGLRRDGTIVALVDTMTWDLGAYVRTNGFVPPELGIALFPGPYRVANYHGEARCVFTNKTPSGTYRGPGRYEGTFVRERLIDLAARELSLDPAEIRRRNFVRREDMPYDVGTGSFAQPTTYDSGDYAGAFQRALDAAGYEKIRGEQPALRRDGRHVGIGIGCMIEKSGLGPWESARAEIDGSGRVVLHSGVASLGEGLETTLAQICADELGVAAEAVTVVYGDTAQVPYGMGAYASRGATVGGGAVVHASRGLREKILAVAAHLLEADRRDLVVEDGRAFVRGLADRAVTFKELARAVAPGVARPAGLSPGLFAQAFFEAPKMVYPYGTHVAIVEVDPDTGAVDILKYVIAYDVGRAINPTIVEGQLVGALAQGVGGAFLEELAYDADGQILTTTFMDYLLPTSMDMPRETVVVILEDAPSPLMPLGIKGAGEGGSTGAGAALANAVADALAPFGERITALPVSPQRIVALTQRHCDGAAHT